MGTIGSKNLIVEVAQGELELSFFLFTYRSGRKGMGIGAGRGLNADQDGS